MKRVLLYIVGATLIFSVFLVIMAPARFVLSYAEPYLPQSLVIAGVRGSIWSGQAVLVTSAGSHAQILSRVHFRFWPAALLRGEWGYVLHCQGPLSGHVAVALGPDNRLEIAHMALKAPAAALQPLIAGMKNMGPSGELIARDTDWVFGDDQGSGGGRLWWRDAGLVSSPVNPLGSYRVTFHMTAKGLVYTLRTLRGKLAIVGHGHYRRKDRTLIFHGRIHAKGLRLEGLFSTFGFAADGVRPVTMRFPMAGLL